MAAGFATQDRGTSDGWGGEREGYLGYMSAVAVERGSVEDKRGIATSDRHGHRSVRDQRSHWSHWYPREHHGGRESPLGEHPG